METLLQRIVDYLEAESIPCSMVEYPEAYFDDVDEDTPIATFVCNISNCNKSFEYNMYTIENLLESLGYNGNAFKLSLDQLQKMWQ